MNDTKELSNAGVYVDYGERCVNISECTNENYKYVLFRATREGAPSFHFLRFSPLTLFEGQLIGDTHLTIIGNLIKEFTRDRNLTIDEVHLKQDNGHGVLWVIVENENRDKSLSICAEVGGFMGIKSNVATFNGDSKALKGGSVFSIVQREERRIDAKMDGVLVHTYDNYKRASDMDCYSYDSCKKRELKRLSAFVIHPRHSIPALIMKDHFKDIKVRFPNIEDKIIENFDWHNANKVLEEVKTFRKNLKLKPRS